MTIPRLPLREAIAKAETKGRYTRRVFATIADRYDLVNVVLSFNRDQAWKRRFVAQADPHTGEMALDLACGTGDIAFPVAARGARVVGLDITPQMIALARAKAARPGCNPRFLVGDMMRLPFVPGTFDLVTTGYGIRNVPDLRRALGEVHRVLKPGGRFFSLDFNRPANRLARAAYLGYLTVIGSAIGWLVHRDPDTYRYIAETVRVHPGGPAVAALLTEAGFERAHYGPVFGGFMAIHSAVKGS